MEKTKVSGKVFINNHDYYFFEINTELTRSIDDMNIKKGIINYLLIESQVTKITKENSWDLSVKSRKF